MNVALHATRTVVGVDYEQYLVGFGSSGVVVLVPENDDGIAALSPGWGRFDGLYDTLHFYVTALDKSGVESSLRAVGVGIVVAERTRVTTTVLVVALVGGDEGEGRDMTGGEVSKEAALPFEADDVAKAVVRIVAFLDIAEVYEWIVLCRIEINQIVGGKRRVEGGLDGRKIRCIGKDTVAEVDLVSTGDWERFLVALPA